MFMSGNDYRESLRACKPAVYVDGRKVKSVAGDADLAPGVNAIALTYDYALKAELAPLMRAQQHTSGREVNRMIHVGRSSGDLLNKLEAVRLVCQETGCAQRYLTGDAFSALFCRRAARPARYSLCQAHRGGALHRRPDRFQPGRLVFGHQPARRRFAGSDENGNLSQLPAG